MAGPWNCCCPGCLEFYDAFDCCGGQQFHCDDAGGHHACCEDEYGVYLATQNLGPAWKWRDPATTGDWWKAASTMPDLLNPCLDGALYEISGTGTLECAVGWPNVGWLFQCDIIDQQVGTRFSVSWGNETVSGDPLSFGYYVEGIEVGGIHDGQWKIILSAFDCSWEVYRDASGGHERFTFYACYDGLAGYAAVGLDTVPFPYAEYMVCYPPVANKGNNKFTLHHESGSGHVLELDNIATYRQLIYPDQYDPTQWNDVCFAITSCLCTDEVTGKLRKHPYSNSMTLELFINCPCNDPYYLSIPLARDPEDPCGGCQTGIWTSEPTTSCPLDTIFSVQCDEPGASWHVRAWTVSDPTVFLDMMLSESISCIPLIKETGDTSGVIFAGCCDMTGCIPPPPFNMHFRLTEG